MFFRVLGSFLLFSLGLTATFPQEKSNLREPGHQPKDSLVIKEWSGSSGEEVKWETKGKEKKDFASTVIRSPEEWKRTWGQVRSEKTLPEVDFEKQMILAVSRGQGSTGGILKIERVNKEDGLLRALVKSTLPEKGRPGGASFTYPYHFVLVPREEKVEFVEVQK
jgi:hypothetical protein